VAGNHDLFVLGRLPATRFPDLAQQSADITRELLSTEVRGVLGSLPVTLRAGSVLMTHGSLDSVEEYVTDSVRGQELLAQLPERAPGADTLVLGHTHRQWCVVQDRPALPARGAVDVSAGPRLLNAGSVGQSRQRERRPQARAAVYDSDAGLVEFLSVDYDVAASVQRLTELGLPYRCLHAPPPLRRSVTRLVRRASRWRRGG
jgi:predicted phosphodiesterase